MNIGIVKETKQHENRVSLVPEHVKTLTEAGHSVNVERGAGLGSGFSDRDYQRHGAKIVPTEVAYDQPLLVRVKEPPIETLQQGQTVMAYLHVEKGQNKELLQALINKNVTAYAFEEIRDVETGKRMVNLGFEAGVAGMFEGLRTYGKIKEKEKKENPFKQVKPLQQYKTKEEAYEALRNINPHDIAARVAIAGYGNVSKGAQEVLAQLSHPPLILTRKETARNGSEPAIWSYLPNINVLVNAVVWKPGDTRVLEKNELTRLPNNSLIIDISCDENGSIETCIPTSWEKRMYKVNGVAHECIDNLPSAVAYDSSVHLSKMILPYVTSVAKGNRLETGLMTEQGKFVFIPHTIPN